MRSDQAAKLVVSASQINAHVCWDILFAAFSSVDSRIMARAFESCKKKTCLKARGRAVSQVVRRAVTANQVHTLCHTSSMVVPVGCVIRSHPGASPRRRVREESGPFTIVTTAPRVNRPARMNAPHHPRMRFSLSDRRRPRRSRRRDHENHSHPRPLHRSTLQAHPPRARPRPHTARARSDRPRQC